MNTTEIPRDPRLRWEWIKFQLRTRGTSLAKLSRELGVSDTAVKNAKRTAYPRMERAIAKALGLQPMEIWPERWSTDGKPVRKRPRSAEQRAIPGGKDTAAYDQGHINGRKEQ